jgi:signal transduction histidine kinase
LQLNKVPSLLAIYGVGALCCRSNTPYDWYFICLHVPYVNDIILIAKAEHPDFLILESVNLCNLTTEIFTKATALGDRHWQLEKIGKGNIVCDRHRVTQVLMNLGQNATQQTKTGDAIVIGSMMKDGKAHCTVDE